MSGSEAQHAQHGCSNQQRCGTCLMTQACTCFALRCAMLRCAMLPPAGLLHLWQSSLSLKHAALHSATFCPAPGFCSCGKASRHNRLNALKMCQPCPQQFPCQKRPGTCADLQAERHQGQGRAGKRAGLGLPCTRMTPPLGSTWQPWSANPAAVAAPDASAAQVRS